MRYHLWLTLAALVPLVSPFSQLPAQEPGTIRGRVFQKESGSPLAEAVARLRETGASARTAASGRFTISNVPAGDYTLVVTALGQRPYETRVTVKPGQPTDIDVQLTPSPLLLNAVVVSASKTQTEIRDVTAAVHVLTAAQIKQSGATNFTEAARAVPGVTMDEFGENFNSIQMRGVPRFGNENEATLILLDGVPQTDARNSAQILTLPIDNIDHIEVVKGPNSALYGRTAIDGVVSIITQDPTPDPRFNATLQAGQWGFVRTALTASGPVSPGSRAGYLLSIMGDAHKSFNDINAYHKHASSLFGKFATSLDDATHLVVSANYALNRGGTPAANPLVNGRFLSDIDPSFSPYTNLNLPSAEYNEEHARTMLNLRRELGQSGNVTNVFGYRHDLWNFIMDGDYFSGPNPGQDTVTLYPFTRPREENAWYDDVRLEMRAGHAGLQQRMLIGATLDRNTGFVATQFPYTDTTSGGVLINYRKPSYPGPAAFLYLDRGNRNYRGTLYSGYAQDEIAIHQRLRLNLGLRYDHDEISAVSRRPGKADAFISGTGHKVSPKVGASYRVMDSPDSAGPQLSVYAQFSKAFRPAQAPALLTVALNPANPLEPEDITNYEGGIKGSAVHNRVAFEVSAFDMLRNGISIIVPSGPGLNFQESPAGKQRFKGVETGVTVQPTAAISAHVHYAYYDGKYEHFTVQIGPSLVDLNGLRVQLSPRHILDVGAAYDRGAGLGVTVSGLYESAKVLDFQNTVFLPSYFTASGRVSYRWQKYTAAVAVTNVFNRLYYLDGEISAPLYAFPAAPRRVIAEFSAAF
jgi:iron complex outermembrane receptor protein